MVGEYFFTISDCIVDVLPCVKETLDRGRHKLAQQVGIALDQIVVRDDAVGDNVDAGIGEPEQTRFAFCHEFRSIGT